MSLRKHTTLLVALALVLSPLRVTAAGAVTADDSIAGLGADIELEGMAPATSYTVKVQPPSGADLSLQVTTDAKGGASLTLEPEETERAGRYRVSVDGAQTDFEILPESVDVRGSDIRALTSRIEPDGRDEAEIQVTLRDRFGNALSGRPVTLVSSRGEDTLYALAQETDAAGVQSFVLSTRTPGYAVVRAIDLLSGNTLVQTAQIQAGDARAMGANEPAYAPLYAAAAYPQYAAPSAQGYTSDGRRLYNFAGQVTAGSFDVIDRFEITAPAEMQAGVEAQQLTIRAVDRNGNTVEDYVGTVNFTSTDEGAELPNFGRYVFKDRDLGRKTFALGLKFQLPGAQTLRVSDAGDPNIFGEAEILVTGQNGSTTKNIEITSHTTGEIIGSPEIVLEGVGPRFANIVVKVISGPESTEEEGSTDGDGKFSVPLTLPGTGKTGDFSILVREQNGRGESEPLFLSLDAVPPQIGRITFAPEQPVEGDQVLVVMESEANLAAAKMTLTDPKTSAVQEIDLSPVAGTPPTYQGFFTAPAKGSYQPLFTAQDRVGNKAEIRYTFSVDAPGLASVRNLRAMARSTAVDLEWDQITEPVDQYRIYVAEDPEMIPAAIASAEGIPEVKEFDSQRPTGKATMVGLKPATRYFFAVTAIQGQGDDLRESEQPSNVVEAETLGLVLTATPQDAALLLEWNAPPKDMPLDGYLLQFGPEDENYQAELTLNGELSKFILRDLINGLNYHLKLTPIAASGDPLDELAAKATGIPDGDGFRPAASDPIPFDAIKPHDQSTHPGAPLTPSGIPLVPAWAVAGAALGGCGVYWKRRRSKRRTAAFLAAIQSRYHR